MLSANNKKNDIEVWSELDKLFNITNVANNIYLLEKFFSLKWMLLKTENLI